MAYLHLQKCYWERRRSVGAERKEKGRVVGEDKMIILGINMRAN